MHGIQPRASKIPSEISSMDRNILLKRLSMNPKVEISDSHAVLNHTKTWKGKQKQSLPYIGKESQSIHKKVHTTVFNKLKKSIGKTSVVKHENEIKNLSNRREEDLRHQKKNLSDR